MRNWNIVSRNRRDLLPTRFEPTYEELKPL